MIGGCSIEWRSGAGGIIRNHSADGGARTRRHIWAETKPARLEKRVQLIEDDSGTDVHTSFFQVEIGNTAIMSREVDN